MSRFKHKTLSLTKLSDLHFDTAIITSAIHYLERLNWLLVKVLPLTWHKMGHSRNIPYAKLLAWYGKTKPNTTKAHIHQSKEMYYNTK